MTAPRIVVSWPRLGPYHLARLRAAHALFAARGADLVALETAGADATYAWRVEAAAERFERVQVFPGATFDALAPAEMAAGIAAALDRLDPDAVAINSYSTPDALAALAWCRRHRRAAVCMTDSTADDAPRTPIREWIKGCIVREFDAALIAGTRTRAYLSTLGIPAARTFAPYDVVDNAFFASAASRPDLPGLADAGSFFLASNRFVGRKNVGAIVRAFARYQSEGGTWRLVLLGDGPTRVDVEELVGSLGVANVTFAGFQQIEALPAYYAAAGAFVHAALVDQWGLVVNEALAAGCPVLVSERAGAAKDLILDGVTGFRFDPDDESALTTLLARVAAMSEAERAAMGAAGQAHVAAWSPQAFAEALWDAAEVARSHADRGPSVIARTLLWAQRRAARRTDSFHAIRE